MNQDNNQFNQFNNGIPNNQPLNNTPYPSNINQFVGQSQSQSQVNTQIDNNISYSNGYIQPTVDNVQSQYNINQANYNSTIQPNVMYTNQTAPQINNIQNINTIPQQNVDYFNQPQMDNATNDDEELLKVFIGKNYDKITTKKLNFAALFFTTLYMFYRKMFLYGILLFIISFIVLNVIKIQFIAYTINLILAVILGFLFNKVYLYYAKNKIEKIKLQNTEKSYDEIKEICFSKGGTNIGKAILVSFAMIAITLLIIAIMGVMRVSSMIDNFNTKTDVENSKSETNNTYNGIIIYDLSVNISNEFSISVPNIFENDSSINKYEYEYEYESGRGVFDSCSVSLKVPSEYSSSEDLINQMATYYEDDNPTSVEKTKINNIDWYWFSYNNAFGTTYYYATTKDNKVYLLEYEINEDASNDCSNYREPILNSINKK